MLDRTTRHQRPAAAPRTVTDLYRDFETALSVVNAIPGDLPADACNDCDALAARICATPANSATEAKLKVRVALWSNIDSGCKTLEEVDGWKPEGDGWNNGIDALISLRDDLVRLTAADADAVLLHLGEKLDAAWTDFHALEGDATAFGAQYDKAWACCSQITTEIQAIPAQTLAGLRVKAKAIAHIHCDEKSISFQDDPTTDVQIAQSIVMDLLDGVKMPLYPRPKSRAAGGKKAA